MMLPGLHCTEAVALRDGKPVLLLQGMKTTTDYAERLALEAIRSEPEALLTITKARVGKDSDMRAGRLARVRQSQGGRRRARLF